MIPREMIEQLRQRAGDPETRTDAPPPRGASLFGGKFRTVVSAIDGSEPTTDPLPATAEPGDIASAEERLGFALPEALVQLVTAVADGGFGPGGGLAAVGKVSERYFELTAQSPDEHGRPWPPNLLPIRLDPPGLDAIDLESGQIVYWDEELSFERAGQTAWTESFQVVAESLEAWMRAWLESAPPREASDEAMNDALVEGLKTSLEYWRSLTPEERTEFGLPEVGWEYELFGHLGVDLDDL